MEIRTARPDELPALQAIEVASGEPFRDVGMPGIADDDPMPLDVMAAHEVWVAVDGEDRPVAFVVVAEVDGCVHIEQISVHPSHARRGIGRRLVDHVAASGETVTLTTFRDVPWNAPYYERLGFRVVEELTPGLAKIVADEGSRGLDPATRVAMALLPAQVQP